MGKLRAGLLQEAIVVIITSCFSSKLFINSCYNYTAFIQVLFVIMLTKLMTMRRLFASNILVSRMQVLGAEICLHKLSVLNMEGCPGSTACLDSLAVAAIPALVYFNLSRCNLSDDECEKFSGLQNLKVLNLGFNDISDACLVHTRGLMNLESLNLDSCRIDDEGLVNLTGSCHTKEWNGTCKLKNLEVFGSLK